MYYDKIVFYYNGKQIKEHCRKIYNRNNVQVVIDFRDHIDELLKKPGAFTFYKHKELFLPTNVFIDFYNKYPNNKNYLECLSLCKKDRLEEVEAAISLLLSINKEPKAKEITSILYPDLKQLNYDINFLKPLTPNLDCYDAIIFKNKLGGKECVQVQH